MIDEGTGPRCLEAQLDLLAGIDVRQCGAAERTRSSVKIDIVRHLVGCRIDKRQLDVVPLVNHHHRARNRAVEGHGLENRALVIDDDRLFLDGHRELDDLRAALGHLIMPMDERRLHQGYLLARKLGDISRLLCGRRCCRHRGDDSGAGDAHECLASGEHDLSPS